MATYERLIKLYRHSNSVTPFEDFTTEILAGILETNPEIFDLVVTDLFRLNENDFSVSTQKTYRLNETQSVRIDLVIENDNSICFLENKVESTEGENQLDNYATVLDELAENKKTYLRYCTKYFDPKDEERHDFKQFRWSDIARILVEFDEQPQINDFYKFLKNHNMANNLEITAKEIFLFENLKHTLNTLDEFLDRIKPAFISVFGKNSNPDNTSQMRKHGRYVFYKGNIFGDGAWNEIGVGFQLNDRPEARVWLWTAKSNTKTELFSKLVNENSSVFDLTADDYCRISIDLSSFLASDNPVEELEKWFLEKFKIFREFIDATPELEWKVK